MRSEYHWTVVDSLRRETTEQRLEIARLRLDLAVARARQYRAEQKLAIVNGDNDAWARATAQLMGCGVTLEDVDGKEAA